MIATSARMQFVGGRRVALLLTMLAVLGMVILASWHDARPHVHQVDGTETSIELGDHHPGDRPEPGDPMHAAAHVVLQGIAIPAEPALASALMAVRADWAVVRPPAIRSIPPASILRPPRA